ncbi:MAG: molybdopterin molybdotransferase MoeA [Gemmatimonadaceae bacterium]|nr:molybdopterin molybdotransferase MoeA [Acetobacteraceae bacterium]
MISVDEARARILAPLRPTPAEVVALPGAWGRVLADPVVARLTQPPADMSAMDGYALRASDGAAGSGLIIAGHAPAGRPFGGQVAVGTAVRLFTGSVVPDGADTVLAQEDAVRDGDRITVQAAAQVGRHIRRAGKDFMAGDTLVSAGTRLTARAVGLIAAGNHPWVSVHRRPRIAILATGDEIVLPGEPVAPGGIVSSNAHLLAAMIEAGGGTPVVLPIASDDAGAIAAVADRLGGIDLLVTTGGASVGEHDLVQAGLQSRGFALDFWQIAMRPGKPLLFGRLGDVPVLGLPGNPVSAFVCGVVFLLPALARLGGLDGGKLPVTLVPLGAAVAANDHRADHLRATLDADADGGLVATPFDRQDSSLLRLLAGAGCLVLRPPHAAPAAVGDLAPVIRLDTLGL